MVPPIKGCSMPSNSVIRVRNGPASTMLSSSATPLVPHPRFDQPITCVAAGGEGELIGTEDDR